MERHHGKPIDLSRLKARVLGNLEAQSNFWSRKAGELMEGAVDIARCPICGGTKYTEAARVHGFPWRQCENCRHVFNGRRPSQEALTRFYAAFDDGITHADDYTDANVRAYRKENVARPKVDFAAKFVKPPGAWLDVGCGNGDVLAAANQMGFDCTGLEPNEMSANIARKAYGLDVRTELLGEYVGSTNKTFDIISFIGLLDILPDPLAHIRHASQVLREHGVVFVSVPWFGSLSTAAQSTFPDRVICRHMHPSVLNIFTQDSIEFMLNAAGLRIEAMWFFGMDVYEMINNLALNVPAFLGSPLQSFLADHMSGLQTYVDQAEACDKVHFIARKQAGSAAA